MRDASTPAVMAWVAMIGEEHEHLRGRGLHRAAAAEHDPDEGARQGHEPDGAHLVEARGRCPPARAGR